MDRPDPKSIEEAYWELDALSQKCLQLDRSIGRKWMFTGLLAVISWSLSVSEAISAFHEHTWLHLAMLIVAIVCAVVFLTLWPLAWFKSSRVRVQVDILKEKAYSFDTLELYYEHIFPSKRSPYSNHVEAMEYFDRRLEQIERLTELAEIYHAIAERFESFMKALFPPSKRR